MDQFEEAGKLLLQGKKLDELTLNGKTFKFSYTREEFINTAKKNQWEDWLISLALDGGEYNKIQFPKYEDTQGNFICDFTNRFCLNSGGFGSGKSLALYIKLILMCLCFPGNRILLGRRTLSDIDRAVLPDLFELLPPSECGII